MAKVASGFGPVPYCCELFPPTMEELTAVAYNHQRQGFCGFKSLFLIWAQRVQHFCLGGGPGRREAESSVPGGRREQQVQVQEESGLLEVQRELSTVLGRRIPSGPQEGPLGCQPTKAQSSDCTLIFVPAQRETGPPIHKGIRQPRAWWGRRTGASPHPPLVCLPQSPDVPGLARHRTRSPAFSRPRPSGPAAAHALGQLVPRPTAPGGVHLAGSAGIMHLQASGHRSPRLRSGPFLPASRGQPEDPGPRPSTLVSPHRIADTGIFLDSECEALGGSWR
ncbi:uncharacterized protein LOC125619445 [Marmota marmota marmota]|uniref:uncharacterized protein LOC125619445 n=1 Tax=Marmota marmota marmota TaxID=9994 RepID=UPI002092C1FB|nr:uncharacterized protein LOC125619445 [Marmota marmota marmota]